MGMFQVRVRVSNPTERSRFFEENFWVDTGALYSFVPEERLKEIGISPLRARELILADGRRDRRLLGEAVLTISQLDESLTCPVIFAPADSLYLLGATALENFGVQADPTTQQLRPIAAVIGGFLVLGRGHRVGAALVAARGLRRGSPLQRPSPCTSHGDSFQQQKPRRGAA